MPNDEDISPYKMSQWEVLFDRLDEYLKAFIIDQNSIHVEDRVYLSAIRNDLIKSLVRKEFDV